MKLFASTARHSGRIFLKKFFASNMCTLCILLWMSGIVVTSTKAASAAGGPNSDVSRDVTSVGRASEAGLVEAFIAGNYTKVREIISRNLVDHYHMRHPS
jgi:hypothetical protein